MKFTRLLPNREYVFKLLSLGCELRVKVSHHAAEGAGGDDLLHTFLTLGRAICVDGGRQAQHQHQDIPLHSSPDP